MQFFPLEQRPHEMGMELAEIGSSESDEGGGKEQCDRMWRNFTSLWRFISDLAK